MRWLAVQRRHLGWRVEPPQAKASLKVLPPLLPRNLYRLGTMVMMTAVNGNINHPEATLFLFRADWLSHFSCTSSQSILFLDAIVLKEAPTIVSGMRSHDS